MLHIRRVLGELSDTLGNVATEYPLYAYLPINGCVCI